jgi:hypothetical protein
MARRGRGTMEDAVVKTQTEPSFEEFAAEDVDVPDDETEEVATETEAKDDKAAKTPAKSKGELPEGLVTPVGLAHELNKRGLGGLDDEGKPKVIPPQMVYSYKKTAPASDPFPIKVVEDSLGKKRDVVDIEEGVAWWERKNERVATRKANATKKAEAKAAKPVDAVAEAEDTEPATEVE